MAAMFIESAMGALGAFGLLANILTPASPQLPDAGAGPEVEVACGEEVAQATRKFLRAGSVYQNPYMCIWNDCGVPVSAVMRMLDGDEFVLQVTNLDSKHRDSVGWIELRGSIDLKPVADDPNRMSIILKSSDPANAFTYDPEHFTRGANFALMCIKRVSTAVLSAFNLEVDKRTDVVSVKPKAAPLRVFWTTPVPLEPASEGSLWRPVSLREGYAGPLPPGDQAQPTFGAGLAVA